MSNICGDASSSASHHRSGKTSPGVSKALFTHIPSPARQYSSLVPGQRLIRLPGSQFERLRLKGHAVAETNRRLRSFASSLPRDLLTGSARNRFEFLSFRNSMV